MTPDAGCNRVPLLRDVFETGGTGLFDFNQRGNAAASEENGLLLFALGGDDAQARYQSMGTFQLENTEVIADLRTTAAVGTSAVVGILGQDAAGADWTIEAGRFGAGFGWEVDSASIQNSGVAEAGADGRWRLRRAGPQFLIENFDDTIISFRADGLVEFAEGIGPIHAYVEGRHQGVGDDTVSFDSVEVSTSPPGGWCGIDQFEWVSESLPLSAVFSRWIAGEGTIMENASVVTLRAATVGSMARLRSLNRYDLSAGAIVIVLEEAVALPDAHAVVAFHHSSRDRFGFWIFGSQLRAFAVVDDALEFLSIAYDDTQHRFLRVTESSAGVLLFETSADNTDWAPISDFKEGMGPGELLAAFPKNALEVHLRADGVSDVGEEVQLSVSSIIGQAP